MIVTLWDEKGVPLSIEEYDGEALVDGKYFTSNHELEGKVENGFGDRIKRDRLALLISRDRIENGILAERTTYHPNGQVHTTSHYHDYQLHGPQQKFTSSGRPLMSLTWNHGVLDGLKTVYRNGLKVAEIPYVHGEKHGMEFHYDDLGNLIAEIQWRNDKKHGCCKSYTEESSESEWFFNGQSVSASKFDLLENRERLIAEFNRETPTESNSDSR
jgi:antitoxin component YwqK of YwqJK toxin-antitoxin module